jgi:hypothetical protein
MTRVMYDSTTAADIPTAAAMVAGYCDGRYRWAASDWARFPNAIHVLIAVSSLTPAGHVLDVEQGDATPAGAVAWVRTRRQLGADPTVYVNRANLVAVRVAFRNARQAEPHYWLATLDDAQPWAPGIVAIQTRGEKLTGRHFDLSIVADYWPGVDAMPPHPGEAMHISEKWSSVRTWYAVYEQRTVEDGSVTNVEIEAWAKQIADDGSNADAIQQKFIDGSKLAGHYRLGAVVPKGTTLTAIVQ